MRRPVNRSFTKPETKEPPISSPSSFEQIVKELKISPAEYHGSSDLREWVRQNKGEKYVPTEVLKMFGFRVDT